MKFFICPPLAKLTSILTDCDLGDIIIRGKVEAYSCKRAGRDKKAAKQIMRDLRREIESGQLEPYSALGPIADPHTQWLLISLIQTMNASFPDYDFSAARPPQFQRVELEKAQQIVGANLLSKLEKVHPNFRQELWTSINDIIDLSGCDVYSYIPEDEEEFGSGQIWAYNLFFFNKKKKMIVFFTAVASNKLASTSRLVDALSPSTPRNLEDLVMMSDDEEDEGDEDDWTSDESDEDSESRYHSVWSFGKKDEVQKASGPEPFIPRVLVPASSASVADSESETEWDQGYRSRTGSVDSIPGRPFRLSPFAGDSSSGERRSQRFRPRQGRKRTESERDLEEEEEGDGAGRIQPGRAKRRASLQPESTPPAAALPFPKSPSIGFLPLSMQHNNSGGGLVAAAPASAVGSGAGMQAIGQGASNRNRHVHHHQAGTSASRTFSPGLGPVQPPPDLQFGMQLSRSLPNHIAHPSPLFSLDANHGNPNVPPQ